MNQGQRAPPAKEQSVHHLDVAIAIAIVPWWVTYTGSLKVRTRPYPSPPMFMSCAKAITGAGSSL
jgi:hypothetical protein